MSRRMIDIYIRIACFLSAAFCRMLITATMILITVTGMPETEKMISNILCTTGQSPVSYPFRKMFHLNHLQRFRKLSKYIHFGERRTAYRFRQHLHGYSA